MSYHTLTVAVLKTKLDALKQLIAYFGTSKQASKQARGSHVRLLANLEKSAWLALAWLVKSGVAACLLEACLIGVYAYTEVLYSVEFVVLCTGTV
jgi:hypothetical protein